MTDILRLRKEGGDMSERPNRCICGAKTPEGQTGIVYVSPYQKDLLSGPAVHCDKCGRQGPVKATDAEAVQAWNEDMVRRPLLSVEPHDEKYREQAELVEVALSQLVREGAMLAMLEGASVVKLGLESPEDGRRRVVKALAELVGMVDHIRACSEIMGPSAEPLVFASDREVVCFSLDEPLDRRLQRVLEMARELIPPK